MKTRSTKPGLAGSSLQGHSKPPRQRRDEPASPRPSKMTARWAGSSWRIAGALTLIVTLTFVSAFERQIAPLVQEYCIDCHDADTKTPLNFETLGFDLNTPQTFATWERIFDRVSNDEMPPAKEKRPDKKLLKSSLASLQKDLHAASAAHQARSGRVSIRRLTRTEYEYTLHDLLGIHVPLAKHLPPESASSRFDTISDQQGISPVHVRSYLAAADLALDEAIKLGSRPKMEPTLLDYRNSKYVAMWFERPLRNGGGTIKKIEDAVVTFDSRPHVMQSDHMGFRFRESGLYRIKVVARGYQARTPVTLLIMRGSEQQGGAELIGSFDLQPEKTREVSLIAYFTPQDFIYPAVADLDSDANGKGIFSTGAADYRGEGIAIQSLTVQGPLEDKWPPTSTRQLLKGVGLVSRSDRTFEPRAHKPPMDHVAEIVEALAPRAFRRPVMPDELDSVIELAKPCLEKGADFLHAVRVPLRALLSSPQFLFLSAEPGRLDDFALASRLSYFLWKSIPDEELLQLARANKLADPKTLAGQVNRMLDDEKAQRFIHDFLGQWLGLRHIDATTPDAKLYPEYDDVLRQGMLRETELFFQSLIADNLPARNLIDSDFTFLNRRLAGHYGIGGGEDETFRKVSLPAGGLRGGLLTQASILKVTANGTVTSPVKRGAFVLTKLLGQPPNPPPPNIGSIEPDTRGATTIRETLDKHRNVASCASCHRRIDPPGFAMESFDPIGGYRSRYRSTGKGDRPERRLFGRAIYEYRDGQPVDCTGVTEDGVAFTDIRDFKKLLLAQETAVARNLISELVVYATGGEIQFADRDEVDRLVAAVRPDGFRVQDIIHQVVQSRIFRNK